MMTNLKLSPSLSIALSLTLLHVSCNKENLSIIPVDTHHEDTISVKEVKDPMLVTPLLDYRSLGISSALQVADPLSHNSTIALENWFKTPTSLADTIKATLSAGQSIQLIALGGGMTACAMNGGLYRQSQLAAYPNLVAKQLGMNDFVTPAFSKDEENGTGYASTHKIINNLAVIRDLKDGSPPTFTSFEGVIHNYATPFFDHATINGSTWD